MATPGGASTAAAGATTSAIVPDAVAIGLTPNKQLISFKTISGGIGSLISDRFAMSATQKSSLVK